jgi:CRISPR-associated protein Csa1
LVYFLELEEVRRAEQEAQRLIVDESLRGWAYTTEPMKPSYEETLPVASIANPLCPCGGDIYLTHIQGITPPPTPEAEAGTFYHQLLLTLFEEAKRFLYLYGPIHGTELYHYLEGLWERAQAELTADWQLEGGQAEEVRRNGHRLWLYEALEVAARLDQALAHTDPQGTDALVRMVLPLTLEIEVDGSRVGLSPHLRVDALAAPYLILDLKTGQPQKAHRLTTTGYALALESLYGHPVNLGCIVYLWFRTGRTVPRIIRDLHLIDEPLRLEFLELRDRKLRVVAEGIDPRGRPPCTETCPYRNL